MSQIKEANTHYDILQVIKERWSPRSFADKEVPAEMLARAIDAARWAASSYNEQPWRFIVGLKGTTSYEKIAECLNEWNQGWAIEAPALLLGCAKRHFSHNGNENRHYYYDLGQSMANLCLQLTADGLYIHQMAGFFPDKARENFQVPEEFEVVVAAAIGYRGAPDQLEEKYRKSEVAARSRKELSEVAFKEAWEQPAFNE